MSDTHDHKDQRLSRIYREGAWPEPSRQIDQAILAASRRAAREQHSFARRWAPSFAIAATVVLTSTLVLKVYREQPEAVAPSAPEKVAAPSAKQPPAAAAPVAAGVKPAPAQQTAPPPSGFSSTMDAGEAERLGRLQRDLDLRRSALPNESPAPPPNFAPAEKPAAALKKEATESNRAGDALQPRRPDSAQAPRARESAPLREQRPATAPVSVFGATPPAAAAPSPAPAPAPAAAAASAPAAALGAATTSGGVTSALGAAPKAAERSPQSWLEDIRKLMAAGRSEEAGAELAEFKKRYPDYVLPEDLR